MDTFLMGAQTPENTISKDFVTRLSVLLPNFVPYFLPFVHVSQTNLQYDNMIYLGSCPSPCFGVHKCSSHSNVRVGGAKAPPYDLPHLNARSWQLIRQKLTHQEQVDLQFRHVKHICDVNYVPYASCFNPTPMNPIPMASAMLSLPKRTLLWITYLVGVECRPIQNHVLCGFQIHDPFMNAHRMHSILRCKCELSLILYILAFSLFLFFCFVAKLHNVAWVAAIKHNLTPCCEGSSFALLCFDVTPWPRFRLRAPSPCASTSRALNVSSYTPLSTPSLASFPRR
jgi:hypothetical protein